MAIPILERPPNVLRPNAAQSESEEAVLRVTIYTRPGCHLCDEMKAIVMRVGRSVGIALEEIDISTDRALEARYGLEIPVLLVEGKKAAKYRITEEELRRVLMARQEGPDRQEGSACGHAEPRPGMPGRGISEVRAGGAAPAPVKHAVRPQDAPEELDEKQED